MLYNSQFAQDVFVNLILNKDHGFFVDIGAGVSHLDKNICSMVAMSNTYALERYRGWDGIAIDYDEEYVERAKRIRTCTMVCEDLTKKNINEILEEKCCPENCDYLSFDVDDAQEKVFEEMNLEKYRFKVITYEHNLFRGYAEEQKESRSKFYSLGYHLLFGNVGLNPGEPVEDWYVDHELFDQYGYLYKDNINCLEIINRLKVK